MAQCAEATQCRGDKFAHERSVAIRQRRKIGMSLRAI
jgi:hypothetical protein